MYDHVHINLLINLIIDSTVGPGDCPLVEQEVPKTPTFDCFGQEID